MTRSADEDVPHCASTMSPTHGRTYNGDAIAYEAEHGRPSRRFLEGAASDLVAHMPHPLSVIRLGAALAEAHDTSAPIGGVAIVERYDPRQTVGHVRLENAGSSTHVAISLGKTWLSAEAAVDLASALLYHAAAVRATHDLDRGFSSCMDAEESKKRGPARIKTGEATHDVVASSEKGGVKA